LRKLVKQTWKREETGYWLEEEEEREVTNSNPGFWF
jgi:hypothetical protein